MELYSLKIFPIVIAFEVTRIQFNELVSEPKQIQDKIEFSSQNLFSSKYFPHFDYC